MTPHIIVQGSSLKYAELPPYPEVNDSVGFNAYQEAIESAIEVHPDSINTLKKLLSHNKNGFKSCCKSTQNCYCIEDGVYPIEAKVRTEYSCKDDGYDGYAVKCKKCDCKQYAIIEDTNLEKLSKIVSEKSTWEEDAKQRSKEPERYVNRFDG